MYLQTCIQILFIELTLQKLTNLKEFFFSFTFLRIIFEDQKLLSFLKHVFEKKKRKEKKSKERTEEETEENRRRNRRKKERKNRSRDRMQK
jgi:hypothetical protein